MLQMLRKRRSGRKAAKEPKEMRPKTTFLAVAGSLVLAGAVLGASQLISEITSSSHGRAVVYHFLRAIGSIEQWKDSRECTENSKASFYLVSVKLAEDDRVASECRLNLSQRFNAVVMPEEQVHQLVHSNNDKVMTEIEQKLVEKFKTLPKLQDYGYYNFSSLDYSLECNCGFQQLCQVKLHETVLEATVEKSVEVASGCGTGNEGKITEVLLIKIPLNGTFVCHFGRSLTCQISTAKTTKARYKLIDTNIN